MWPFNKKNHLDDKSSKYGVDLVALDAPTSNIAEQFRTLQTNINFSNIGNRLHTLLITSDGPSEGKSTVSANLAVTYAQQGMKTILLDFDLRRPTVHKTFSLPNRYGVSTYLSKMSNLKQSISNSMVDNLKVMTSGPIPPNPAQLFSNGKLDQLLHELLHPLNESFDLVIVDAPPVNLAADTSVLANKVDGVIVTVPQGIAQKDNVKQAVSQLRRSNANILGTVMNWTKEKNNYNYYYYYKK